MRKDDDDMPIGKLTRVGDFLPPPSQLAVGDVTTDRVVIEGLRCQARVGVTAEERRVPQRLLLDLALITPLAKAGRRDDMTATVDYARAAAVARQVAEGRPVKLVEAIAERVAAALLREFRVDAVEVRLRKFSVPSAASVGICITRSR